MQLKFGAPILCASLGLGLAACQNAGSNSTAANGVGPVLNATSTATLFASNPCLSGKVNLNGSGWYISGNITLSNSCQADQVLQDKVISFIAQTTTGQALTLPSFNAWWVNNDQYTINFNPAGANQVSGVITSQKGGAIIHSGQTIQFDGGINLPDGSASFDSASANQSLVIDGGAPVVEKGKLLVTVDTQAAGCTATSCANLKVVVNDNNNNPVATVTVPAANVGGSYSQLVDNLPVGRYNLIATTLASTTTAYQPSPTPQISANTTSNVTVSYVAVPKTGSAMITVPTLVTSYQGQVKLEILNSQESNLVVASYLATPGQALQTAPLPVSDAKHQYRIRAQGMADPQAGRFYQESGLLGLTIAAQQVTSVNVPYKLSNLTRRSLAFALSGLVSGDSARINFQDAGGQYAYPTYSGLKNANVSYSFESGLSLGYSLQAQAGSYKINPISANLVVKANQTLAVVFESNMTPQPSGATVAGWPEYLAMGAVGGPNTDPVKQVYAGGDDSFGGKPVDAVFKYAGVNGNGDPGVIDPPMNALRMTTDLSNVSAVNDRASRVVMVEYTGEMSGGENFADFTNSSVPNPNKQNATYLLARHFMSLALDAQALADKPVMKDGKAYFGSLILNPDLLGAIQQNGYINSVNQQLPTNVVNTAVAQTLCLLTNVRSYTNTATPNGDGNYAYKNKTYTGTPYQILTQMLADGYPAWSISNAGDAYWGTSINNSGAQIGTWFDSCVAKPTYDNTKYSPPNFPAGFDGWVQANNWLIRTFAPKDTGVTFGWQENMWAVQSGFWLHKDLTSAQIAAAYSSPVSTWLATNAPSAISNVGSLYAPDYFVFDRYETDDSAAPGAATLYSARSWDNYLSAVGLISKAFNNIPVMLWQLPGSHLPYVGEAQPELFGGAGGGYIYSTAPVYFFGDSNLKPDLSNLITGPVGSSANLAVGSFSVPSEYSCPLTSCIYLNYLRYYNGQANNYDWSKNNGKLALAAANNVFAILWGGGNTTNVIKNFSNPDDHGWLAAKIQTYYQQPQRLK